MGLMDKVKAQATRVAQKAQGAAQTGQSRIEGAQSKHKIDGLLRDLGAAVYAQHQHGAAGEGSAEIDRLLAAITAAEVQNQPTGGPAGRVSSASTATGEQDESADGQA